MCATGFVGIVGKDVFDRKRKPGCAFFEKLIYGLFFTESFFFSEAEGTHGLKIIRWGKTCGEVIIYA